MEASIENQDDGWVNVMGEGIRTKKVVVGSGEIAQMNTIVSCHLTGYFGDDKDHKHPFETLKDQVFVIGEMDTLPAIELTLRHARVGDKYWLRSSYKFAFGLLGRAGVPRDSMTEKTDKIVEILPNADLEYYIEVTGHHESAAAAAIAIASSSGTKVEGSVTDDPIVEVTAETELRKVCGNRWFSYGDFPKAGKSYAKGMQIAQNFLQNMPDPEVQADDVEVLAEGNVDGQQIDGAAKSNGDAIRKGHLMVAYISCMNNLSACHISMKEYAKAKDVCVRVLELEPDNLKALLRGAKAALALHEYDECSLCLENVKRISPTHPSLAVENARLKSAKLAYKARDKAIGKKMASKLFPENKITKVESGGKTIAGSTSDLKVESEETGTGEAVSVSKGSSGGQDSIGAVTAKTEEAEVRSDSSVIGEQGGGGDVSSTVVEKTPGLLPMILCSTAVLATSIIIAMWLR